MVVVVTMVRGTATTTTVFPTVAVILLAVVRAMVVDAAAMVHVFLAAVTSGLGQ